MLRTIKLFTTCFLFHWTAVVFAQPGSTTTIAFTGGAVPGGSGETSSGFPQFYPVLNANGTLTFHADTSTGDSVLISENEVAIRTGEQVPGAMQGTVVSFFETAPFAGGVYIPATFTGPDVDGHDFLVWQRGESPDPLSASDLALWQAQYGMGAGSPELVVSSGTPVSTEVPEPGTVVLLARIGLNWACLRRLGCA